MKNMDLKIMEKEEVKQELNMEEHQLRFTSSVKLESSESVEEFFANLRDDLLERFANNTVERLNDNSLLVESVLLKLREVKEIKKSKTTIKHLLISWRLEDELLGCQIVEYLTPSTTTDNDFDWILRCAIKHDKKSRTIKWLLISWRLKEEILAILSEIGNSNKLFFFGKKKTKLMNLINLAVTLFPIL